VFTNSKYFQSQNLKLDRNPSTLNNLEQSKSFNEVPTTTNHQPNLIKSNQTPRFPNCHQKIASSQQKLVKHRNDEKRRKIIEIKTPNIDARY
jgi:hypothetical protein